MSIAKKSMKWLVAAIIAFALVLTAIFAVGNVATASADDDDTVSSGVIVLASSKDTSDDPYPNLTTGTAYTITADYYLDIPASGELSAMWLKPVLNTASATAMRPSSITRNPDLPITVNFAEDYCNNVAGNVQIYLDPDADASALDGYDVSNDTYTLKTWLFRATYTLSDEAAAGVYTFSFTDGTEFSLTSGDVRYLPAVKTSWAAGEGVSLSNASVFERAKGTFNLRKAVTLSFNDSDQGYSSVYGANLANIVVTADGLLNEGDLGTLGYSVTKNDAAATLSAVGEYTLTTTYTPNDNYVVTIDTATYTITPKTVTLAFNDNDQGYTSVYGASLASIEVTATGLVGNDTLGTLGYSIANNNVEGPHTLVNVGTYTLTTTYSQANSNYTVTPDTATYTITKKKVSAPSAVQYAFDYNGQPRSIIFGEVDAAVTLVNETTRTNVGTTENAAYAFLKDSANTEWTDGTIANKYYNLQVNAATVTLSFNDNNAGYSSVYGENLANVVVTADGLVNAGDLGTLSYSVTKDNAAATLSAVGTYTLTTTYTENANYTVTIDTATYTINKKSVTIAFSKANYTSVYGEPLEEISLAATGLVNEGDLGTISYVVMQNEQFVELGNVGQYSLVNTYTANPNYTVTQGAYATYTITPKTVTLAFNDNDQGYTSVYGASLANIEVTATGLVGNDTLGTLGYSVTKDNEEATLSAVGTYTLTTTYTENANYTVETDTATYTINPKTVTLSFNDNDLGYSSVYGASLANIEVTATGLLGNDTLGTLGYSIANNNGEGPHTLVNVGTYTLTTTYSQANSNYTVTPDTATYTINPKTVTLSFNDNNEGYSSVYGADLANIVVTADGLVGNDTLGTLGYSIANNNGEGPHTLVNAGTYTLTATYDTTAECLSNYTVATDTATYTITKVQITKPTPYGSNQYVYDSYNKQFMLDVVSAETGYYTISNNIRRNAGSQTVTVSLKDKTNTEWADGTTTNLEFTLTVQQRPVNLSVSADAASHVYGNTPANVSISATGIIDAFSCSYKAVCVDGEAPYAEYTPTQFNAGLNAGHYTLNPVYNDINGNYDVTVSEPFAYEVIKREITIPTAVSGLRYTGSEQSGVTKTDGSFYDLYSGSDEETAVGNYSATYRLKSTTNCYWAGDTTDVADKTVNWSIGKAQITKPSIEVSYKIYNGSAQTYSGSGTGYTFTGSGTNFGTYPVTVSLTDTTTTEWNDGTTEDYQVADKLSIEKKSVTLTITKSASSSEYGSSVATITVSASGLIAENDLGTLSYQAKYSNGGSYVYYTKAEFEGTNPYPVAKSYILEAVYTENANYYVSWDSSPYTITPKAVTLDFYDSDDEQPYGLTFLTTYPDSMYYITVKATGLIGANDLGELGFTATHNTTHEVADITVAGAPVGTYTLTPTYTPNANYDVTALEGSAHIFALDVDVPVVVTDTYYYDGTAKAIVFDEVASQGYSQYYTITGNSLTEPGTTTVTVALKPEFVGNVIWGYDARVQTNITTTSNQTFTLTVNAPLMHVTFTYNYGEAVTTIAEDVEVNFVNDAMRALPSFRFFKTAGWRVNGEGSVVTAYTKDMDGKTLNAEFIYAVGTGDANGDGKVTAADILLMKRYGAGLETGNGITSAADAWAAKETEGSYVFVNELDVNGKSGFHTNDIVALREGLATGYDYKIINHYDDLAQISYQKVVKQSRVTVTTYEDLVNYVAAGYPVLLGADIDAATKDFNLVLDVPADIALGNHTLTVNSFTLSNSDTDATLKIAGGNVYTVEGISVTAPAGNVVVSSVNGYTYEGAQVVLAAYNSSLHIESNVGFYQYKKMKTDTEAYTVDDFKTAVVTADDAIAEMAAANIEDTNTKIQAMVTAKAEHAAAVAAKEALENPTQQEIDDAEAVIETKAAAIAAIDVFKAPVSVPVDTHVVVEAAATLEVEQITVVAPMNDDNASTFSVNVKSTTAEVIKVDVQAQNTQLEYLVDEVALEGNTDKVEIVKAADQAVTATVEEEEPVNVAMINKGTSIAFYATLDAAAEAAQNGDTIVLLSDVTYGTDRVVPVWEMKAFDIDLNGKTFTTNSNQSITLSNNGYKASAICFGDNTHTSPARNIRIYNGTIRTAYGAGVYIDGAATATLENLTVAQNYPANVQTTDEYSAAVRVTGFGHVIINSGSYSGKNAITISNSGGTVEINGGDFRGNLFISTGEASNAKILTIKGGTFDHDPSAYVADGYEAVEDNGIWTVDKAYVARIGETKYETLDAAVAAVNASENGGTITLLADLDFSDEVYAGYKWVSTYNPLVITQSNVTIDLNDHTISNMGNNAIVAGNILAKDGRISNFTIKNGTLLAGKTDNVTNSYVFDVAGVDGALIKNITSVGGINAYTGSKNVVIEDCSIQGTKYYTVCAQTGSDVIIRGTTYTKNTEITQVQTKAMFWVDNVGTDSDCITSENPTGAYGASSLTIESGNFIVEPTGTFYLSGYLKPVVKGGTFTVDPTACLAEGYVAIEDNGIWTVEKVYAAQIGETKYETFDAAVEAAQNGDTIVLLSDVTYGTSHNVEIVEMKAFDIDLNGKTFTTDSTQANFWASAICYGDNENTSPARNVKVYNGTIVTAYATGVYIDGAATATLEDLTVNAATVGTQPTAEYSAAVRTTTQGTVIINNGTYTGTKAIAVSNSGGYVTINGGSFSGALYIAKNTNTGLTAADKIITINGGTFTNVVFEKLGTGTIAIYGGTFDHDPTAYVADGYVAIEDNGIWTVLPGTLIMNETELKAALASDVEQLYIGQSFSISTAAAADRINVTRDVVLNLNGYTLTCAEYMFVVQPGATLEIVGEGTICYNGENANMGALRVMGSADQATTTVSKLIVGEDVTVQSTGYGIVIWHNNYKSYGSEVVVKGTINAATTAICPSGNIAQQEGDVVNDAPISTIAKITVESTADLTATNDAGIYAAGFAVWDIKAGATITGASALYIKSGYLNIPNGVNLTATKATVATYKFNGNGGNVTGDGIVIDNCYYPGQNAVVTLGDEVENSITVTAEGAKKVGTYWAVGNEAQLTEAINAQASYIFVKNDICLTDTATFNYKATLDMGGKKFYNTTDIWNKTANGNWALVDVRDNGDLTITGNGTFDALENDVFALCVKGSSAKLVIENGTFIGNAHAVYVYEGDLEINGGDYSIKQTSGLADPYGYIINLYDSNRNNGTANAVIYGGTYQQGFNPADCSAEGANTNFVAGGYVATEANGVWTVSRNEIEITTFAELKAAIASVNSGDSVNPVLLIANDIAFEEELEINKSVTIKGDGETKFIGYNATNAYCDAFFVNVADEDQEITIEGIVFDHFMYYSDVANKTKATASNVINGTSVLTYSGNCTASTTLSIVDCTVLGTARDMINVSSSKGCKGFINIERCTFDATDRLSNTLNMLSFYGNEDAELSVFVTDCTFREATEQNATWATSAIASFGNADLTITGCEFIACQVAIGIDNTFDRLYETSTYPCYVNSTVTVEDNTYTNCYFGYYEESIVASASDIPEGFELDTDSPRTFGDYTATQFTAYEYDHVVAGTQGVDAKYLTVISYYVRVA